MAKDTEIATAPVAYMCCCWQHYHGLNHTPELYNSILPKSTSTPNSKNKIKIKITNKSDHFHNHRSITWLHLPQIVPRSDHPMSSANPNNSIKKLESGGGSTRIQRLKLNLQNIFRRHLFNLHLQFPNSPLPLLNR